MTGSNQGCTITCTLCATFLKSNPHTTAPWGTRLTLLTSHSSSTPTRADKQDISLVAHDHCALCGTNNRDTDPILFLGVRVRWGEPTLINTIVFVVSVHHWSIKNIAWICGSITLHTTQEDNSLTQCKQRLQ